ncbi:MAG TPA: hypothetical protein VL651_15210 [Bacteroidia bacterium]|nr:hypothetical protein [Bacteroidia bacterium]
MKFSRAILLYIFYPLLLLVFSTCTKEKIRKEYSGDFLFTVHGTYSETNHPVVDTTFTYSGTIEGLKKKQDKNVYLNIWYKNSSTYVTVSIDDNRKLSCVNPVITGSFSDDDHLSFTTDDLTQDHCYYEEVTGVRK